ncbi:Mediator of RNA polymerase II transcription subunit 10 [Candida viswanathii]|uniref:Mediator of RNA polymerase II transcription subunit 10 n=1 Tax=Candida viswanathii TaxID=5486 RepID=A0A367YDD3_9ASCO|nr:Mediator of RNA polymerase II transcription subunit 10 [Candida viswanathii]
MTTGTLTSTPNNQPLIKSAENVSNLIESFIELGVLVHDNQGTPQSNQATVNKLNQLINQLKETSSANEQLKDYPIPIDVISYIEDGRNPDIYTREFIEVNAKNNARLKGKMNGFKTLRDVFGEKLKLEFPDLEKSVDDIVKRTSVEGQTTHSNNNNGLANGNSES